MGKRVDLAISVEVVEHVSAERTEAFFDALCSAADIIVFSGAIPYQGGTHHINEQPQSIWIEHFESRDFEVYDIFRPRIWTDEDVRWWFRQNIFLFIRRGSNQIDTAVLRNLEQPLRDVVHPVNYVRKIRLHKQRIRELEAELAEAKKVHLPVNTDHRPSLPQILASTPRRVKQKMSALRPSAKR